ncbi:MAG: DUF4339 domain-containing protein [Cephaloticoccus sp.]|nr:DUF4339 domain-containing protein [Cephaloticoccus sp.]
MATQEFYVRNESETEARGPFNIEQLSTLIDNGQITTDTLFYDATTEQWAAIDTSEELKAALFPVKKALKMRTKHNLQSLNAEVTDSRPPITVDDMLAAAEGRTTDTKDRKDPEIAMARAAAVGIWSCVFMLIIAALAELLPAIDFLMKFDPAKLLENPLVILGAADAILAIILMLGMVTIYPVVRFRAALGFGFLGFVFYTQGLSMPFLATAGGSVGLYLCTVSVSLPMVVISGLVGLAGMAGLAYHLIMTP